MNSSCHVHVWVVRCADTLGGFRRAGIFILALPMLTARCVCRVYVRVMSHVCISHVHISMSPVTYMYETCPIYVLVMSHIGMSHEACGHSRWVQKVGYIASCTSDADCQVYVSYICMSHVTYMYESWGVWTLWVVSGGRVYLFLHFRCWLLGVCVTCMYGSCTYMYESCHICVYVISHICMSDVTYMHESWPICV